MTCDIIISLCLILQSWTSEILDQSGSLCMIKLCFSQLITHTLIIYTTHPMKMKLFEKSMRLIEKNNNVLFLFLLF